MVNIPADSFTMGDTNSALAAADADATPVQSVTLGAFTMSSTPITQAQYRTVMGTNPSFFDSVGDSTHRSSR